MRLFKDNTIYVHQLFGYQLSRNIYRVLPYPCKLKILINILRYPNSFGKLEKEN